MRRVAHRVGWAAAALAVAAISVVLVRDAIYWEKPLPGVEVRALDLDRPIAVTVEGRTASVSASEVLLVNTKGTQAALRAAGHGSFRTRVRHLVDASPPRLLVDPMLAARPGAAKALAERLSAALPRPRRAQVVSRRGEFRVIPSLPGAAIEPGPLLASLTKAALTGSRSFTPALTHVEPELTTSAAEAAVAEAKELVGEPIALSFKGGDVGSLAPQRLARLVRLRPDGDRFHVTFAADRIAKAVEPYLSRWRARAVNARFVVEGSRVRIRPSKPGLAPDGRWISDSISLAAVSPIRRASLRLKQTRADLTTREADKLGIRQQISSFTTEMGPSSANRIHNIHLMAEYIDGTLIKPGETFSFNGSVGPRTAERGFLEGQMIIGSLLVPSIGGGVCQTATTLFNNAFELGLPILARQNHSFYISHYPMGRDAAVSWGGPDFSFRNDLKTGILIGTSYTNDTLTFSFYGTDPKRRIVAATGPQVNWRTPETTYALDPYAPNGSVRTVSGSNQSGFDVTVSRKIYERGKLLRNDSFTSAYIAVGPTQIYGPGSSIPGPYFVLPRI
ncbi:MAG: VanW family protein [Gaiellaceae bacterium MAG52_C11]|nr:VanW family protein [Candidatus Gaiellasilicea maunaloa]